MRYFLITGLDNGEPIMPYIVETENTYPYILSDGYGDKVRYYQAISEKKAKKLVKNGAELY